jgi:hypothetical protein
MEDDDDVVLEAVVSQDEVERRKRAEAAARGEVVELSGDEDDDDDEARARRAYRAECKAEDKRRAALAARTDWCVFTGHAQCGGSLLTPGTGTYRVPARRTTRQR